MTSLTIAVIRSHEGKQVGSITASSNVALRKIELTVKIEGTKGKQIAELLNKTRLIFSSSCGEVWLKPIHSPQHMRPIRIYPLLTALSEGELKVEYNSAAIEEVREKEMRMALEERKKDRGERIPIDLEEIIKRLELVFESPPSPLERLIEEYQSSPNSRCDWLSAFSNILTAAE